MREERRKARRFSVLGEQQAATLRVGDVSIPVRLVDQSATGFAIRLEEHPGVFPGEVVWLQTVVGWTEVRVMKVRHEVDGTQIGLQRIADLATGPKAVGRVITEQLTQDNPHHNPWPLLVLVLGLAGLLGFLIWTAAQRQMVDGLTSVLPSVADVMPDRRPAAVKAIEHEAARQSAAWQNSLEQLGAAMLVSPEVMAYLKLDAKQQQRLQQLVQSATRSEAALRQQGLANGDRELDAKVQQLRQATMAAALEVLDETQQTQWQTMFDAAIKRLESSVKRPNGKKPTE